MSEPRCSWAERKGCLSHCSESECTHVPHPHPYGWPVLFTIEHGLLSSILWIVFTSSGLGPLQDVILAVKILAGKTGEASSLEGMRRKMVEQAIKWKERGEADMQREQGRWAPNSAGAGSWGTGDISGTEEPQSSERGIVCCNWGLEGDGEGRGEVVRSKQGSQSVGLSPTWCCNTARYLLCTWEHIITLQGLWASQC